MAPVENPAGQVGPDQVEADLRGLEAACDLVAERLNVCATHVNEGRLDESTMMLVIHRLAARLMGGPA